jgi:hypothetical protein
MEKKYRRIRTVYTIIANTGMERAYMQGISSVYQTDSIEDAATIAAAVVKRDVIGNVEVYSGRGA